MYKKRKAEGKVKSIHDQNKKKQARQHNMWRINSKRYYERKRQAERKQQTDDESTNTKASKLTSHQSESDKKRARVNRLKLSSECSRLARKVRQSQLLAERWKKKYQRLRNVPKSSPSPRKIVKDVIKRGEREVKRRLLFGEVLRKQLKHNYASCSSQRAKQMHAKVISGTIVKKYKLGFMARGFVTKHLSRKYHEHKVLEFEQKERKNAIGAKDKDAVHAFMEEDINSSLAPEKKDCITEKGIKKQKRYMNDSVHRLYKQYLKSTHTHTDTYRMHHFAESNRFGL